MTHQRRSVSQREAIHLGCLGAPGLLAESGMSALAPKADIGRCIHVGIWLPVYEFTPYYSCRDRAGFIIAADNLRGFPLGFMPRPPWALE